MADLAAQFDQMFPVLWAPMVDNGQSPVGAPFCRYFAMIENTLDFEAVIPIPAPYTGPGPVMPGELPGGEAAAIWRIGPYDGLGASHDALETWVASQGRTPASSRWEIYWTDPSKEPDPAKWRTEIIQPLEPLPSDS